MKNNTKVNKIARKMGITLLGTGITMLKSAFNLTPKQLTYNDMLVFMKEETAGQKLNYISLADTYYYVIPWKQFKEIIDTLLNWLKSIPYIKDKMDCDDFAYLFSTLISVIFGLNSQGVVHGRVNIGHFWNAIVAEKDGQLKLFYYDVKRGTYMEHEKGRPVIMKGWSYLPDSYRFF